MIEKILIANRGEIAIRVIKTCQALGIKSVSVYSDEDINSKHVKMSSEAYHIGSASPSQSYLNMEKIVEVALQSGAQAVHPGYGFLSENADFADLCARSGLVFIGPPPGAIRAMGDKSAAKATMEKAGVATVPGYHGDDQAGEVLRSEARRIGYPVLIKASAGGGGKGMRAVGSPESFDAALAACRREATSAFGDDRVLIEKYLDRPRHIELQ